MRRVQGIGIGVLVVLLGLMLALPPGGGKVQAADNTVIRVGLVRSLFQGRSETIVQVVMRPFKVLLEAQTGMTGVILTARDSSQLGKQLRQEEVQLGVFHGIEFAWARLKNPRLKPLVIAVNGKRFLRACLVVRKDSPATGPADLKDKDVALPVRSRTHCRVYLEHRCAVGPCARKFFGKIVHPLDTEDALDAVYSGQVAAAVVDASELEAYGEDKGARLRKLKVLCESEPFPCGVVAYYPGGIADAVLERIRAGMLTAHSTRAGRQFLQMAHLSGFEAVSDDYLEALDAIAKRYPPPGAE